jgi:hypothetical protein
MEIEIRQSQDEILWKSGPYSVFDKEKVIEVRDLLQILTYYTKRIV